MMFMIEQQQQVTRRERFLRQMESETISALSEMSTRLPFTRNIEEQPVRDYTVTKRDEVILLKRRAELG
jgi:hypothetical protein